ncbi:MAG TPA: hypothetical protein [Caudoviricetes sp.]|nr:MAG TPA: hypothetical protein [Caudoviricetes sp.]
MAQQRDQMENLENGNILFYQHLLIMMDIAKSGAK